MASFASQLRKIIRQEGYISVLGLTEDKHYTPEKVLLEAIGIQHIDLVDMLMDEYPELHTRRVLDEMFYFTNLTHYPKVVKVVLSHLSPQTKTRYTNIKLARKNTFESALLHSPRSQNERPNANL